MQLRITSQVRIALLSVVLVCLTTLNAQVAASPGLASWDMLAATDLNTADDTKPSGPTLDEKSISHDAIEPVEFDVEGLNSIAVAGDLLNGEVLIDGYVLPLSSEFNRVVEFLLVPWVGACIHTPSPPPNQIVHVSYPDGLRVTKQFEPMRFKGVLTQEPAYHPLFLVDGSRAVPAVYSLQGAVVSGKPGTITAASASNVPALARAQIWINNLFINSMSSLASGTSFAAMAMALLLSFGYGALHTLGPGHGKSVVVSYFVGTGGSLMRGISMGVRIAVIHVLSAVVLVFALDFAVRQTTGAAPSDYRIIRLGSYALIIAIGSVMVWNAVAPMLARRKAAHAHGHHDHDHHHHHNHDHHHQGHHHHHACAACAAAEKDSTSGWIAASVGVVPCTGALLVMLFGLANDLVWEAILMVAFISLGMAVAMSAIGVTALLGRRWVEKNVGQSNERLERFETGARLAGSVCVLVIGLVLFGLTLTMQPLNAIPQTDVVMSEPKPAGTSG